MGLNRRAEKEQVEVERIECDTGATCPYCGDEAETKSTCYKTYRVRCKKCKKMFSYWSYRVTVSHE